MASPALPPHLFTPAVAYPAAVHFRLVEDGDRASLHACCYAEQPVKRFHDHFARLLRWQGRGRAYWLVAEVKPAAEEAARLVAGGQLLFYLHGTEIANLVVAAAWRNQGLGTAMIEVLLAIARHSGRRAVELGVMPGNERVLALYQRLGFVVDRQVRLPGDESATILRKAL